MFMFISKSDVELFHNAYKSPDGLARTIRRLIQEVEVLKGMLKQNGLWNQEQYRKAITQQFIHDHNSAGGASEISHSDYPYLVSEVSFLKRLNATEEEIKAFEDEVDYVSSLT